MPERRIEERRMERVGWKVGIEEEHSAVSQYVTRGII